MLPCTYLLKQFPISELGAVPISSDNRGSTVHTYLYGLFLRLKNVQRISALNSYQFV